jgi:GlpG protein
MKAVKALCLPMAVDLSGFVHLLQQLRLPFRATEERGEQVLWVADEVLAEQVRSLYEQYPQGAELAEPPAVAVTSLGLAARLRQARMTAAVLLLTLLVAVVTRLGADIENIRWFSFNDFRILGDYLQFLPLADSLAAGQWWRLITPMLLHFGLLHLAMNSLWYWELGRRIELRQGAFVLLALTLVYALVSNVAQSLTGGPSLFGGLSGVLYGLLGHCWLLQRLAPSPAFALPRGVVTMMLVWLLLCLSGLITLLGFGQIANAAHVGGLVAGCLTGVASGMLARRRQTAALQ